MGSSSRDATVPYRWLLLGGLILCSWGLMWYGFTLGVLLPGMSTDLRMTVAQQGWLSSAFFGGQVLFAVPVTRVLTRFAPLRAMTLSFAVGAVCMGLAAIVPGYWPQLGLRLAASLVFVAITPIRTSILTGWFERSEVPRANGIFNSGFGGVQTAGIWVAGALLAATGNWRAMTLLFASFGAVGAAAWGLIERAAPPPLATPAADGVRSSGHAWAHVALHRDVVAICLIGVGGAATWAVFLSFWPTVAQQSLGLSSRSAGFILGCTSVATIPASLVAARAVRFLHGRLPFLLLTTAAQVPTFALFLVTGNVPLLIIIGLLQGLTWIYFPILVSVPFEIEGFDHADIAMATAFFVVMNGVALAIGPSLAGLLATFVPLRTVLMGFALAPLVSIVGAAVLGSEHPAARRSRETARR